MNRSTNSTSDWTTFGRDLLVSTAGTSRGSWTAVLCEQLRTAIREGILRPGVRLPATRTLAKDLGLSRGIIVSVYEQLGAEGYLESQTGSGTSVAAFVRSPPMRPPKMPEGQHRSASTMSEVEQTRTMSLTEPQHAPPTATQLPESRPDAAASPSPSAPAPAPVTDYRPRNPGLPDPNLFPRSEWLKAYRRAFLNLTDDDLRYGDPQGFRPLRAELADYLGRVRGIIATPDQILITNGYAEGLFIIAHLIENQNIRLLQTQTADPFEYEDSDAFTDAQTEHQAVQQTGVCIAVEDPGSSGTRDQLADWGCKTPPVRIDKQGLVVEALERTGATAVLVTPAHHYPTGSVLSAERRIALLDWARKEPGRIIIEDDYDAEFRYDNVPVGSMQPMAPDLVITGSSVSKTLSPALRLGWLVLPPSLVEEAVRLKTLTNLGAEVPGQAAMAEFLRSGAFDRHVRRSRVFYRKKRKQILDTLTTALPGLTVSGAKAGLSLCLEFTKPASGSPEPASSKYEPKHKPFEPGQQSEIDDVDLASRLKKLGVLCEALSNYSQSTQAGAGRHTNPSTNPPAMPAIRPGLVIDLATTGPIEIGHIIASTTPLLATNG